MMAPTSAATPNSVTTMPTPVTKARTSSAIALRGTAHAHVDMALIVEDTALPAVAQRRVDQGIHHPAHHRLRLAVCRAADVLEDDHRLDAVDDGQRLDQAPIRTRLQSPLERLERGGQDLGALAAAERFFLEEPGGFERLVLERQLERRAHVRLIFLEA